MGGVRFTYRLTWVKGTGPCGQGCSQNNLYTQGNLPSYLVGLSWVCISGCANGSVILHDVNYIVTSVSTNSSGWEQGEGFFFYNFVGSGPFTVTYVIYLNNNKGILKHYCKHFPHAYARFCKGWKVYHGKGHLVQVG